MLVFVLFGIFIKQHKSSERAVEPVAFEVPIENETPVAPAKPKPSVVKKAAPTQAKREQMEMLERLDELVPTDLQGIEYKSHISEPSSGSGNVETAPVPTSEKTSLELLEEITHANTVKRAQEMGISTEGSTLDIMERINHANTVKRAQEMGVSTEGSTLDIMERINHANTVKRAQEMGVSTEGSTLDIMERINHANTVKRAQEVGVSTEGTTLEILERINRKHLENR